MKCTTPYPSVIRLLVALDDKIHGRRGALYDAQAGPRDRPVSGDGRGPFMIQGSSYRARPPGLEAVTTQMATPVPAARSWSGVQTAAPACSSAPTFGVGLVLSALADGVGPVTFVGGGVTET